MSSKSSLSHLWCQSGVRWQRHFARLVARLGDLLLGPVARAGQIIADAEALIIGHTPGIPHVGPVSNWLPAAALPRMRHAMGAIVNHARAQSPG